MNFRVVDEHGRQLGMGRDLAGLKAEFGRQARSAFQALAALKLQGGGRRRRRPPCAGRRRGRGVGPRVAGAAPAGAGGRTPGLHRLDLRRAARADGDPQGRPGAGGLPGADRQGANAVEIEVFDEPELAAAKHRAGLRRLVSLQIREPLKYLEKNIPDLPTAMGGAFMGLGGTPNCARRSSTWRSTAPPGRSAAHRRRAASSGASCDRGRARGLTLIAQETGAAACILGELPVAQRKLKDSQTRRRTQDDVQQQLQRLMPAAYASRPARLGGRCSTCRVTSRPSRCAWTSFVPTRRATPPAWRAAPLETRCSGCT